MDTMTFHKFSSSALDLMLSLITGCTTYGGETLGSGKESITDANVSRSPDFSSDAAGRIPEANNRQFTGSASQSRRTLNRQSRHQERAEALRKIYEKKHVQWAAGRKERIAAKEHHLKTMTPAQREEYKKMNVSCIIYHYFLFLVILLTAAKVLKTRIAVYGNLMSIAISNA